MNRDDAAQEPSGECRYCQRPAPLVLDPAVLRLHGTAALVYLCAACWRARDITTNPD